jgi:hypothetical protein
MSSKIVMNNSILRQKILSYFRKKPEIICYVCKKVCKWDNKIIRQFVEIPIYDYTILLHYCMNCYWKSSTAEIMGH